MHYMNGRNVTIGDWVVGKTHNGEGAMVGVVIQTMPQQGPCNVRLKVFPNYGFSEYHRDDDSDGIIIPMEGKPPYKLSCRDDYADCAELLRVDDGLRLANAAKLGHWQSNYCIGASFK